MFNKTMKKTVCGALALVSVAACAATFTACETAHPEVEMKITFNDKTYTLDYKLYRKRAPKTVAHFIWLAENGYYNGLCVHDYDADDAMYTGAYETGAEATELKYRAYREFVLNSKNYNAFPHSVWGDAEKTDPLLTLKGEFDDNDVSVGNTGSLKESFGSLTMYYHDKDVTASVYALREDGDKGEVMSRQYKYNSATSLFYISLSTSQSTNDEYCTFATLEEDSVSVLEDLQEAIAAYIESNYSEEDDKFVTNVSMRVDEDDPYVGELTRAKSFEVPNEPIVISSVKVKKY